MPSECAASITDVPCATCTGLPSIAMFSSGRASGIGWHQTVLVIDVILEFVAEILDEALHRQRGGIAQRADRAPRDVVGNRVQRIQVFVAALPPLDPIHPH